MKWSVTLTDRLGPEILTVLETKGRAYTQSNNVSSAERKALQTREDWGYGSAPQNILKFSVFPKDISLN